MFHRSLAAVVPVVCVALGSAHAGNFAVLVKTGLRDTAPTEWTGTVALDGGTIAGVTGWRFSKEDSIAADGSWSLTTDAVPQAKKPQALANGVIVSGDAGVGALLRITIGDARWNVPLASLAFGVPVAHESKDFSVESTPRYHVLSGGTGEDDYPAACALPNGGVFAVWQSFDGTEDRLLYATLQDGEWSETQPIPGLTGDLYQPECAAGGDGQVWVTCPRFIDGTYVMQAVALADAEWSEPVTISDVSRHAFNQAMAADAEGNVLCVWQQNDGRSSDIFMARATGGEWDAPGIVSASPANEWSPAIASGPAGTWIAWDTYMNGSYDVYASLLVNGFPADPVPIAASPRFEAKASVACDSAGRVWVAWQDAGENWGKDTGYTVPKGQPNQGIYRERNIRVACIEDGALKAAPEFALTTPDGQRGWMEEPRLAAGADGRIWLAFRHPVSIRTLRGKVRNEKAWEDYLTFLDGDAWSPPMYFAGHITRIDTFPAPVSTDAGLTLVCHSDGRTMEDARRMTRNSVYATTVAADVAPTAPVLTELGFPEPAVVRETESADIERVRDYVVDIAGQALKLVRGDTHRHTEVSWDGTGDGSILDAYRYAMDAAGLEFFLASDHNQRTGIDIEYIRRRSFKIAEIHSNPPAFNAYFGYERSLGYPNGHRNMLRASRDYPSYRMTGNKNDLPGLYEYCREYDALAIAHTTGSNHGTNWYAYDRDVEPVVEIFQGCRTSYEYEGAPKSATPGDRQANNTGYQPEGFVWRAWQRDQRLGIIASSDHGSTHYSYACVYTDDVSRRGILDAMRRRHTFGATDNIIIETRVGDHLMGEEWTQDAQPELEVKVIGTGDIARIDVIKDYEFVYTSRPDASEASFTWMDNDFADGTHLYYVRVQQADENIAWASPMWVTKG